VGRNCCLYANQHHASSHPSRAAKQVLSTLLHQFESFLLLLWALSHPNLPLRELWLISDFHAFCPMNKPKPSNNLGLSAIYSQIQISVFFPWIFFHHFTTIAPKRDRSKPFEVNFNTYRWSKRSLTTCKLPFRLNDSNSCIRNHIRVCHIHETRWPRDFNSDISTCSSQSKMCCKRALTQIVCTGTDFLRLQDGANC